VGLSLYINIVETSASFSVLLKVFVNIEKLYIVKEHIIF
jgi:hypothetical protein